MENIEGVIIMSDLYMTESDNNAYKLIKESYDNGQPIDISEWRILRAKHSDIHDYDKLVASYYHDKNGFISLLRPLYTDKPSNVDHTITINKKHMLKSQLDTLKNYTYYTLINISDGDDDVQHISDDIVINNMHYNAWITRDVNGIGVMHLEAATQSKEYIISMSGKLFKNIINIIDGIDTDAQLKITNKAISVKVMDPSHVSLIAMVIPLTDTLSSNVDMDITLGIDTNVFKTILKNIKNEQAVIKINYNPRFKTNIYISNSIRHIPSNKTDEQMDALLDKYSCKYIIYDVMPDSDYAYKELELNKYTIPLIDPRNATSPEIPNINNKYKITVAFKDLYNSIVTADTGNETVSLEINTNNDKGVASDDTSKWVLHVFNNNEGLQYNDYIETILNECTKENNECTNVKSTFSIEHLLNFLKDINKITDTTVTLYLDNDHPIKIECIMTENKHAVGLIEYYLAPRVDP